MALAVGVLTRVVFNILRDNLQLKPYKLQDCAMTMPLLLAIIMNFGLNLKNSLICSDEAYI